MLLSTSFLVTLVALTQVASDTASAAAIAPQQSSSAPVTLVRRDEQLSARGRALERRSVSASGTRSGSGSPDNASQRRLVKRWYDESNGGGVTYGTGLRGGDASPDYGYEAGHSRSRSRDAYLVKRSPSEYRVEEFPQHHHRRHRHHRHHHRHHDNVYLAKRGMSGERERERRLEEVQEEEERRRHHHHDVYLAKRSPSEYRVEEFPHHHRHHRHHRHHHPHHDNVYLAKRGMSGERERERRLEEEREEEERRRRHHHHHHHHNVYLAKRSPGEYRVDGPEEEGWEADGEYGPEEQRHRRHRRRPHHEDDDWRRDGQY